MADITKIQPIGSSTQYELGARYLTTARTFTIGDTGKTFNGTADVSWSKAEILGSSNSRYFLRGDGTWSNTLETTEGSTLIQLVNKYNGRTDSNLWLICSGSMGIINTPAANDNTGYKWILGLNKKHTNIFSDYPLYLQHPLMIADATYGECLRLWTDSEGGNISFRCAGSNGTASNTGYEIDTAGNNLRLHRTTDNGASASHVTTLMDANGALTAGGNIYIGSTKAGGYLNGAATNGGMNSILIGDDCWLGDCNSGGIIAVKGNNSNSQAGFFFFGSNGTDLGHLWYTGTGHSNVAFYGACWNDYAEMRNVPEANDSYDNLTERKIKLAGRCVHEVGDGTMVLSTSRLERGCKIISDTFGFNIGETDDCKTPIAVSGRVLAYLSEGREVAKRHIGWPVCSGPNGTVSIMTEEEEEKYPSRIIGTISEIPDYETWGSGNVPVNNRIWIYVR